MSYESNTMVDATATTATEVDSVIRKDNVLERLNKRNKDRQNYLDVKLEQRNKENLQVEGADLFHQTFGDRVREIEARITNIAEVAMKKKCSGGDASATNVNSDLTRLFAEVTVDVQELQRYLTNSTMFLADYKVKARQNELNELMNSCEETRQRLLPKKKFGFSGKKVAPKTVVNPKLSMSGNREPICEGVDTTVAPTKPAYAAASVFSWTISNRQREHIYLHGDEEINGKDITISNLDNCVVELRGHAGSLQISNAKNCTFLCGPVSRSVFVENCNDSKFALSCQQLRLHGSHKCFIFLHVTCRAIIEDCTQINVGPFNYTYAGIERDFELANLDKHQNNYQDVADFNWLSPDVPSPNWHLLSPEIAAAAADWSQQLMSLKASWADVTST